MSHLYEVALYGEFFAQDLKPILNRLTLHCESGMLIYLILIGVVLLILISLDLTVINASWCSYANAFTGARI